MAQAVHIQILGDLDFSERNSYDDYLKEDSIFSLSLPLFMNAMILS
jgi:hypothetical protein